MSVKISIADLIGALRDGLATKEELQAHLRCSSVDLHKPLGNLVTRKLGERYLDDGKPAYRLTAKGKAWKRGSETETHGSAALSGADQMPRITSKQPQPEVGKNTSSDGSESTRTPDSAEAVAVLEPAPQPCCKTVAAAENVKPTEMYLLNVIADIRATIGDTGQMMLDELAPRIRQVHADAEELHAARQVLGQNDTLLTTLHTAESQRDAWRTVAERYYCDTPSALEALLAGYRDVADEKLRGDLTNAQALADKLQHLLDSRTHECESLRAALNVRTCTGEPDLETVPLHDLIRHAALYLDDGQALVIHPGEVVAVRAMGREFVSSPGDANALLDAAATLMRAEVEA